MTNSPTDLHARLLAAVHARRELAEAAIATSLQEDGVGNGAWRIEDVPPFTDPLLLADTGETFTTVGTLDVTPEAQRHIAANDPAQILRDTDAHLKILAGHKPNADGECPTCCGEPYMEETYSNEEGWVTWHRAAFRSPCSTLLAVAIAYPEVIE